MKKKLLFIFIVILYSCKKESINPYKNPDLYPPLVDTSIYFSDSSNFSSLYNNIFAPYCANSGCHDGSFEPDFRSINSSYNTLVYHPVIKNNSSGDFTYRVNPGNADESVLFARMISDSYGVSSFDPNSQVMPLTADIVYDPNQTNIWHENKLSFISNIRDWINDGAKDIYGNIASTPNNKPVVDGVAIYESGTYNLLPRIGRGTVQVSSNIQSLDIWFSINDDFLHPTDLNFNKVKFSNNLLGFDEVTYRDLIIIEPPINEVGYYASNHINYYHYVSYDISSLQSGDEIFIKIYIQDDTNQITEIPTNGSSYQYIKHFTFEIL
tara:strand:- start:15013 stop:15984 length:972 start_codon:yes stop_codon:yes gene_type:complete